MKNCNIVQDLLPNYIEKLTSEETNTFIEEHLNECDNCKNIYESMKKDYKIENEKRDRREVEYIKKYNKKMKVWKKILLIALVIFAVYACSVIYKLIILSNIDKKNTIFRGNADMWEAIIDNILNNFMRYAKKTVKITVKKQKIILYNDGENINENVLNNIFTPYEKGLKGVFGLGLSIVKKTLHLLNYDIIIENVKNGVKFTIYER